MFNKLAKTNPNIAVILVSIVLSCWFGGLRMIFSHFFPQSANNLTNGIILCCFSLVIFLLGDNRLNEIYKFPTSDKENN